MRRFLTAVPAAWLSVLVMAAGDSTTAVATAAAPTWSVAPSPNPPGQSGQANNTLRGVSCVSSSNCWAVGSASTPTTGLDTLIEHWDGTRWSLPPDPPNAPIPGELYSVSCVAGNDCLAVGDDGSGDTLTEHWDGTQWAVVSSAPAGSLYSVSCAASADCLAVGSQADGSPLALHWNGSAWSSPVPRTGEPPRAALRSVSCVTVSDCWAAGTYQSGFLSQTLVEHWDGTTLAEVASPDAGNLDSNLLAVTCASSADCWATGFTGTNPHPIQTLTEHWNGAGWSIVPSPNQSQGQGDSRLNAVSCRSGSDCVSVGAYRADGGTKTGSGYHTLIEQWDGKQWKVATSPNPNPAGNDFLDSVSCLAASPCWAVGQYFAPNPGGFQIYDTLIEEGM